MLITSTIDETRISVGAARAQRKTIGLVPTMGFLHAGHRSLIAVARDAGADFIVVSIFVNPLQFGPAEDFERYPRDEKRDRTLLEEDKVNLLFVPTVETIYPAGSASTISVGTVATSLEGARRPGHFEGVATVCAKLFNIVQPDLAAFGRKDAQQCAVVDRLINDLNFPLRLVLGETVREDDGLAMSSRNSYLSAEQRAVAPALYRALRAGDEALRHNVIGAEEVERLMHRQVAETPGVKVDYLVVVDPVTFMTPRDFDRDVLLTGAVRIGRTRLIDNILVRRNDGTS